MRDKLIFLLVLLFGSPLISGGDIQPKKGWLKPNAWEDIVETEVGTSDMSEYNILKINSQSDLPQGQPDLLVFYAKLLRLLFSRENYNKNDDAQLERAVLFRINEDEMKLLEKSTDPKDWDEFVTKVFVNAKTTNVFETSSVQSSFADAFYYFNLFLNNSWLSYIEDNVLTASIILICSIIILHIKYNYNLIALSLLAIVIIGFFSEYQDCNNELAIEKMVDLLDKDSRNPCDDFNVQGMDIKIEKKPWYKFWSPASKKEECADYLRKQSKKMANSEYCRADHVLWQYVYNVYMKQFEMLIRKSIELNKKVLRCFVCVGIAFSDDSLINFNATPNRMKKFSTILPSYSCGKKCEISFPWNIFAFGAICFLSSTFLALFFKYIIAPLISRIPSLRNNQQEVNPNTQAQNNTHHDSYHELLRLQNENIDRLTRLTAFTTQRALSNNSSKVEIIEENESIAAQPAILTLTQESSSDSLRKSTTEDKNSVDINKNEEIKIDNFGSTNTLNNIKNDYKS